MVSSSNGILSTLIISLVAAFAGGLFVRVVRFPPLLGYLAAGAMIGPFTPGIEANQTVASELAEVGVALLLFNIGLHFSLKDLAVVRRIAVFGALIQMAVSCSLGFLVAWQLLGFDITASFLMGLSFSVASTAISTRLLEEKHQFSTYAGRIALGWLVVQDIAVIVAMVIVPFLVNSKGLVFGELARSMGETLLQVAGFAVVILFGVRKVIPQLLSYVARVGSRELFTLAVIVIALGIAYGSSVLFGVSLALGAFFAGVVIGETDLNHHAAAESLSMQQVFTILFFVSVGMLFDPSSILRMPFGILASWGVIVIGIGVMTSVLLVFARVRPEAAAVVGGAFSQIGEFSFILSQVGYKWGILNQDNRDLILAVALMSIIGNPAVMYVFTKFGRWVSGTKTVMRWLKEGETHHFPGPPLAGHVILIGHGRVGHMISDALRAHDIAYVTIESDRRLMERLLKLGLPVIFGDATREQVLAAAHPETARLVIITLPQAGQVRRVISLLKQRLNPDVEVIVRVHEDAEAKHMTKLGIGLSVMGEREIALGLSGYALQYYGVESHEVLETLSHLRQQATS